MPEATDLQSETYCTIYCTERLSDAGALIEVNLHMQYANDRCVAIDRSVHAHEAHDTRDSRVESGETHKPYRFI